MLQFIYIITFIINRFYFVWRYYYEPYLLWKGIVGGAFQNSGRVQIISV